MTIRHHSPFTIHRDYRGREVAKVRATQGRVFELLAADWDDVRKSFGKTWYAVNDGRGYTYIAGYRPGLTSPVTLARAITRAGKGERVTFADGNPMNLRRENLAVGSGAGRHQVPDVGYLVG